MEQVSEKSDILRISLRQLGRNQSGVIRAVNAEGDLGRRIREIGLVPGIRVTVQGRAPLFDPVALRVMGCTITLRNSEADHIEVEPEKNNK